MRIPTRTPRAAIALAGLLAFAVHDAAPGASTRQIDIEVDAALERFYDEVPAGKRFVKNAEGVLVFPDVVKAGFGLGGEYGEGAMRIGGRSVEYYSTAAASIGFQIGVQTKTVILVFLQRKALERFRRSDGWKVGVDGSVNLIEVGAGGTIDTENVRDPIVGFILTNKGLMYNLTLEGSKFTKLDE